MSHERNLHELKDVADPAWPLVQSWLRAATNPVEVLPVDLLARDIALAETQVTLRSPMGAVLYETGGILIDHGWLRILGSGHPKMPRSMPEWNRDRTVFADKAPLGFWLVGDDVVGGFFALNGRGLGPDTGRIFYFAPDTLRWEPMAKMGYSEFLVWALSGKVGEFYETMRWPGWETEIAVLHGDEALSIWPPLWTTEGGCIATRSRRLAPVSEVYGLNVSEFPKQLDSA